MTIIAYKDGVLAADSRALTHDQPGYAAKSAYVVKKMQVFKNKIAVATTGNILSDKDWEDVGVAIEMVIGMIEVGEVKLPMQCGWMLERWFSREHCRHGIVMTRVNTYLILEGNLYEVPPGESLAFGSGGMIASSVMQSGGTALEAVDQTCLLRRSCGHPILSITRDELVDFKTGIDAEGLAAIKVSVKGLIIYDRA